MEKSVIRDPQELKDKVGASDQTEAEKRTIAAFVIDNERKNPQAQYLEIGVFGGGNIFFLRGLTNTTHFTGVDLFEDFELSKDNTHLSGTFTLENVRNFLGHDRVSLVKGDSTIELPKMNQKFDFIFIDGNHAYNGTMVDFNNAVKLLNPKGQIAFHNCSAHFWPDCDYIRNDGGPWLVVQELKASPDWRLVAEIDRICVFTRR